MTRKRTKHEQIADENKRNATFEKKASGLLKNANDLSILCGVDMGIVIHKHEGRNNEILWPSPEVFGERLQRFLRFPNPERDRKMVTQDAYVQQTLHAEEQDLAKMEKRIHLKESHILLNELEQGKNFNELNLSQLSGLKSLADEMLEKIQEREYQLNEQEAASSSAAAPQSSEGHRWRSRGER